MIITEQYEINGRMFTKTYSNAHRYVVREGVEYTEANDPTEFGRTYEEGNLIEDDLSDSEKVNALQEVLNVLLGEDEEDDQG